MAQYRNWYWEYAIWSLSAASWVRTLWLTSLLQVYRCNGVALAWVELVSLRNTSSYLWLRVAGRKGWFWKKRNCLVGKVCNKKVTSITNTSINGVQCTNFRYGKNSRYFLIPMHCSSSSICLHFPKLFALMQSTMYFKVQNLLLGSWLVPW